MSFPRRPALLSALIPLFALPVLSGCENSATSMMIEGKEHAMVLVREQPYFWSDEVRQFIVVSRLPQCQRRISIHPNKTSMEPMTVYEAGDLLWALHQGRYWYLASTDGCQVQDWNNPNPGEQPPGAAVGHFVRQGGVLVFVPVSNP